MGGWCECVETNALILAAGKEAISGFYFLRLEVDVYRGEVDGCQR